MARAKVVEAKALERQVEGSGVGESEAAEGAYGACLPEFEGGRRAAEPKEEEPRGVGLKVEERSVEVEREEELMVEGLPVESKAAVRPVVDAMAAG